MGPQARAGQHGNKRQNHGHVDHNPIPDPNPQVPKAAGGSRHPLRQGCEAEVCFLPCHRESWGLGAARSPWPATRRASRHNQDVLSRPSGNHAAIPSGERLLRLRRCRMPGQALGLSQPKGLWRVSCAAA